MDGKNRRIGLVVDYLTSEYSENLIEGVVSYCKEHDIYPFIFPIGELNNTTLNNYNYQYVAVTSHLKKANIDGIIIVSGQQMHRTSREDFISFLEAFKSLPIINISMALDGIPSIVVNYEEAFEFLIQYLIDSQHCRKFGFIGVSSNSYDVQKRTEIFKEVLVRNSISLEDTVFWETNFDYSSAYHTLEDYYKKNRSFNFDAIVSLNDDMAFACMDFCKDLPNLSVPKDLLITGFDDINRSSLSTPTLTSINQQVVYQAYIAADSLCSILDGKKIPILQTVNAKVLLRQSSQKYEVDENKLNLKKEDVILDIAPVDNNRFSVFEWYKKRSQLFQAALFYSELNYETDIKNIGNLLTQELKNYGFHSVAIVVYEKPIEMNAPFSSFTLPEKAYLLGGFDYKTHFNSDNDFTPFSFNPREELLPPAYINNSSDGYIVSALFHNFFQYGYVVIRREKFDLTVYNLVVKALGNQIAACFSYTSIVDEKSKITDKYQKMDIIVHTDYLTGLRNRRGFIEFGNSFMNLAQAMSQTGIIIYCDIDGLKKINDNYGHEAGDIAIKAQGDILKNNFRRDDIIARLSGDEFAIVSPSLTVERFNEIKKNIENDCKKWKKESSVNFNLSLSMGYTEYPTKKLGYNLKELLAKADAALYKEKKQKKIRR